MLSLAGQCLGGVFFFVLPLLQPTHPYGKLLGESAVRAKGVGSIPGMELVIFKHSFSFCLFPFTKRNLTNQVVTGLSGNSLFFHCQTHMERL